MIYQSTFVAPSGIVPGVSFTIRRVSVVRRLALLREIRELCARLDFYRAGEGLEDKLDASIASSEIEALYVRWGITRIDGLTIDGLEVTPDFFVDCGPEDLVREAASLVRAQLGLTEQERKN
jgi:hypothetical protein